MPTLPQMLTLVAEAASPQTRHRADLEATLLGFCEQWAITHKWSPATLTTNNRDTIRLICNAKFPLHPECV